MASADAVVTNFFHGCVFALRNGKPFVCETSPYRGQKIRDLLTAVGGEAHLLLEDTSDADLNARLNAPVHPSVFEKIAGLRETSAAYLDEALFLAQARCA